MAGCSIGGPRSGKNRGPLLGHGQEPYGGEVSDLECFCWATPGGEADPATVKDLGLPRFENPTRESEPGPIPPATSEGMASGKKHEAVLEVLPFILGEALPVVPAKLVKRIMKGESMDKV